jgi:uncharacterized metal-binding protein
VVSTAFIRDFLIGEADIASFSCYSKPPASAGGAFTLCMGLRNEAKTAAAVFETNGFEVVSAICKIGGIPKPEIGLMPEDLLNPKHLENLCNPAMQAMVMNEAGVDFNILLGLCVEHDSLAIAHAKAPVTVLAVKDRLLGHNPLSCLYMYGGYYNYLSKPLFPEK